MGAFKYLKASCPVCQGARRDCRQSTTTSAIHCRAEVSTTGNYEPIGFDTWGFTIYALGQSAADPNYWADQERYRQQLEQARQQEQSALKKRLSIPRRDRMFRTIARSSGLATRHRQQLEERCTKAELPQTVISQLAKKLLLFTWQPGQAFGGVTSELPGVDRLGRLRGGFNGWTIAIPDAKGRILGAQIKPETGGGYFWVSSKERGGSPPHLDNGELPVGVYWPSEVKENRIGIAEGYLKSALAAERFGFPFIGMAGGHFKHAPEQFEAAVKELQTQLPGAELVLYPDAGQLEAKHANVHSAWRGLSKLCEKLKLPLRAAWWGQTTKAHGDVDEASMSVLRAARLIPMAELIAMVEKMTQDAWKQKWEQQAKAAWERCRRYTPTAVTEQRYVDINSNDLFAADIHALKSAMGTGKTRAIAELLKQCDLGVVAIGSRNSLLLQSCERWGGFYHLHSDAAFGLTADPYGRVACCVDSLKHFGDNDFSGKILILDEVLSVVKHALLSSTLKDRRDKALAKFERAIRTAAVVIAWDGNNADIAVNYLAALRGEHCRVIKALNQYRGDRLNVEMIRVLGKEGTVWLSNNKPILNKVGDALRASRSLGCQGKGIVVVADSQSLCESMDRVYSEQGFKVLRVDRKTAAEETTKEFLKDPDGFIAETQPDLLVMSPTAESGIDISIADYFYRGFALFFGQIDTATQTQFLRRVRKCLDWTVWCVEYKSTEELEGSCSPLARKVGQQLTTYLQADAIASLKGQPGELTEQFIAKLKADTTSAHYQTALQFMAARNYERQHTRECLQQSLEESGHTVKLIDLPGADSDSYDTDQLKEAKKRIIEAEAQAIFNAPDISATEAARIKSSFSASVEDGRAAEKALLKARLPGIELSEVWEPSLIATILYEDKGLIRRTERFWLMNHIDVAIERSKESYLRALEYGGFLPDIKSDLRLLQALKHLEIGSLAKTPELYDNESPEVQAVYQKCKRSHKLQAALGRAPGRLKPVDWLGRLMRMVGITSVSRAKPRAERGQGAGDRWYSYYSPAEDVVCSVLLQCIERRFEKYLHPQSAESPSPQNEKADHLNSYNYENSSTGELPQSGSERGVCGFSIELVAEVREMRREAASQGAEAVEALRSCFDSELWSLAG